MNTGLINDKPRTSSKKVLMIAVFGVVALAGVVLLAGSNGHSSNVEFCQSKLPQITSKGFAAWSAQNGKKYSSEQEAQYRFRVFSENALVVKKLIETYPETQFSLNKFADLTNAEFKAMYANAKIDVNRPRFEVELPTENLTDSVDWRTKGAVTPIKDQGMCGSCWAFSATGSLEGLNFIKNGKLLSFSEQQLVDCSKSYGNMGCNGGLMDYSFQYVQDTGIELESDYAYKAMDQKCKFDSKKVAFQSKSFTDVPQENSVALAAAVAQMPVSVAIEADTEVFQFYTGGIITSNACGTNLDHGVLAVGYGSESGQDFWIVKNSWGTSWGDNGYVKIAKTDKAGPGICGIAMMASYPTL